MIFGPWRYAIASAIGTSHIKSGAPCQDAAICEIVGGLSGNRYVVALVSDGAGSAKHSDIGSKIATDSLLEDIRENVESGRRLADVDIETVAGWIENARREIAAAASSIERKPRDYACTMLGAIIGDRDSAFFQVGDGAIVIADNALGDWSYMTWPDHGEYANTTSFITDESYLKALDYSYTTNTIFEAAVFSDGIERLVLDYKGKSVHAPFFERMMGIVRKSNISGEDRSLSESLERYLSSPAICERTDDDKSLILISRRAVETEDDKGAV